MMLASTSFLVLYAVKTLRQTVRCRTRELVTKKDLSNRNGPIGPILIIVVVVDVNKSRNPAKYYEYINNFCCNLRPLLPSDL